jgi:hypothetical protein
MKRENMSLVLNHLAEVVVKNDLTETILWNIDPLDEILESVRRCQETTVGTDRWTARMNGLLHQRAVTLLVSMPLRRVPLSLITSPRIKTIRTAASMLFSPWPIFHMAPRLVDEVQQEAMVDHRLFQVDSTADLLVPKPRDRPLQIDPLLLAHHQHVGEEATSRMLVQLLLQAHLEAPGADSEMLVLARTCPLPRQSMQLLQAFIPSVLLRSVVAVTRYLPLLRDNHHMGPAIAMDMADSQWVEQTLLIVPILVHDKHLEGILVLQPVNQMFQPDRLPASVAVVAEGSSRASIAPCNKPKPTCPTPPEAAAEGEVRHANPLAVAQMLKS